jgi:hypothetical protein
MSTSILQEQRIVIPIENKPDIEKVISYEEIPEDELRVLEGSEISNLLRKIKGEVSLSLIALADERYGVPGYTMGDSENLKIIETKKQKTPIVVKNYGLIREREKDKFFPSFRDNGLYVSYHIVIESPSRSIWDRLRSSKKLAPWAMPDSTYEENNGMH